MGCFGFWGEKNKLLTCATKKFFYLGLFQLLFS